MASRDHGGKLSRYNISQRIDPSGYCVRFRFGRTFQSLCVLGVALDNLISERGREIFQCPASFHL